MIKRRTYLRAGGCRRIEPYDQFGTDTYRRYPRTGDAGVAPKFFDASKRIRIATDIEVSHAQSRSRTHKLRKEGLGCLAMGQPGSSTLRKKGIGC